MGEQHDFRRTVEDHYLSLHLLKEGLQDAQGLNLFLSALAKAILELDASGNDRDLLEKFLKILDLVLKDLHEQLGSDPTTVAAANKFVRNLRS